MLRWECPNGLHSGVLAPSKPRRDDVRRYCLDCSTKSGRLTERVSPKLAGKREAAAERVKLKAAARREKARTTLTQADVPCRFASIRPGHCMLATDMTLFRWHSHPIFCVKRVTKPRRTRIEIRPGRLPAIITIYDSDFDAYDARGHVIIAELSWAGRHLPSEVRRKGFIAAKIERTVGVRPRLLDMSKAGYELGELLRRKAEAEKAVEQLGRATWVTRVSLAEDKHSTIAEIAATEHVNEATVQLVVALAKRLVLRPVVDNTKKRQS